MSPRTTNCDEEKNEASVLGISMTLAALVISLELVSFLEHPKLTVDSLRHFISIYLNSVCQVSSKYSK